nr:MAG TPA: hypothetical protein [Caudoviricetes sp.]
MKLIMIFMLVKLFHRLQKVKWLGSIYYLQTFLLDVFLIVIYQVFFKILIYGGHFLRAYYLI